jgi:hypothetical protein
MSRINWSWAKVTPNVTDIAELVRVELRSGSEGIAAINTIMSVMGINLDTLRPEHCVEGYSTPGGFFKGCASDCSCKSNVYCADDEFRVS